MELSDLLGMTLVRIEGMEEASEEVVLHTNQLRKFRLYHEQDCCEDVRLVEVIGLPEDLLNTPLRLVEETSQEQGHKEDSCECSTWTFYRFGTDKGYVTLRWLGESNGYYSERVDFEELVEKPSRATLS